MKQMVEELRLQNNISKFKKLDATQFNIRLIRLTANGIVVSGSSLWMVKDKDFKVIL